MMDSVAAELAETDGRFWVEARDVAPEILRDWKKEYKGGAVVYRQAQARKMDKINQLIFIVRGEVSRLRKHFSSKVAVLLIDIDGVIVDSISGKEQQWKDGIQFGIGASLAMKDAGFNAAAASIKLGEVVAVSGSEHQHPLLKRRSSICSPIRLRGNIIGYLDLCFGAGENVMFPALLLYQIISNAEAKIASIPKIPAPEEGFQFLDNYGLTAREKEVGIRWLRNESVVKIAADLFITEGTVRNMIKKVYAKTKVHSKGEFMTKFLV
ncbi:helix-turn-helix transcriptional regulator [Paenibacillus alkalitolerans]|uniref:helix-turn-helix transcriptional regulator n=1 Tax=Paenibacillus alkalitolerans TaxID=2799335 RepID=UPI0018F2ED91|nr:LuxR C-terminal-related transcriptional regulator [Paenibacillus alkalitolerans]